MKTTNQASVEMTFSEVVLPEQVFINSLVSFPENITRYGRIVLPEDLYDSSMKTIYTSILEMAGSGIPISHTNLDSFLTEKGFVTESALVIELMGRDSQISPSYQVDLILNHSDKRLQWTILQESITMIGTDPDKSLNEALQKLESLRNRRLLRSKNYDQIVFTPSWDNEPENLPTLAELSNVNILTRGNIAGIIALPGAGKSSLLGAACASAYNPMSDTLGLRFYNGAKVLYIDTERCKQDHHRAWRQFMRRCEIPQGQPAPENIQWVCIRAMGNIADRVQFLLSKIDCDTPPDIVLIDCVTDFMTDPNDLQEAVKITTMLSAIAHRRNVGILMTLHPNPNSEKARGHIGSEIMRKAESVILIEKQDEISTITTGFSFGKNRNGSTDIKHSFMWDNDLKMHVSCDCPVKPEVKGKTAQKYDAVKDAMGSREWAYKDLVLMIVTKFENSERTAKDWISAMTGNLITKTESGLYQVKTGEKFNSWMND